MTTHILVVQDDAARTGPIAPALDAAGYRVTTIADGQAAIVRSDDLDPDLILLDLGLPDIGGSEIVQNIRMRSDVPIILISGRDQEGEKIAAIDEGADDFLTAPFEIGELLARIRVSERRRARAIAAMASFQSGRLAIDFRRRQVVVDGESVRLSPKEYALLALLACSAGEVVGHRRLLAAGWGQGATDTQYLRVYIGLLRQKVEEDPADPRLILTEPGIGYRLASAH